MSQGCGKLFKSVGGGFGLGGSPTNCVLLSGLLFLFVLVSGFWFLVYDLHLCIMSCVMFCFFHVLCLMF